MQLGSLNSDVQPIEKDLADRMEVLFGRCPSLHGFTVLDQNVLPPEYQQTASLESGLVVAGIGIFPEMTPSHCEKIYDEISVALLDFLLQRPEAKEVLRGRTFARSLH